MLNCEGMEQNLMAYLDAKADPALCRQVEAHLEACAVCRQWAGEFRQLWTLLDEMPAPLPSLAFDAAVQARIAAEPRRGSLFGWKWTLALVPSPRLAFAATALAVLSVWLLSVRQSPSPVANGGRQGSETEFGMIKDLPVLEDYDVLANFDALSELPVQPAVAQPRSQRP